MSFLNLFTFLCIFLVFFAILGWKNSVPHYLKEAYNYDISLRKIVFCVPKMYTYFKNLFNQISLEEISQEIIIEKLPLNL
jgi:hypothetical protein